LESLLPVGYGLAERGAVPGSGTGLPTVRHGLVPHLTPQGLVREPFDLFAPPVPGQRLKRLNDAGMQRSPPLQQKAAVGYLVRQGVLEGVLALRKKPRLVKEFRRLQVGQAPVQLSVRHLGNRLHQRQGYLRTDYSRRLEEALSLGWQSVDTGCQDGLYGG